MPLSLEESLAAKLVAVLTPVSAALAGRVFADVLPAVPNNADLIGVTYQRQTDEPLICLDTGRDNTRDETYTLTLFHPDRGVLEPAREAIYDAFAGPNCAGRWGGDTGVWVQGATAGDAAADAQPPQQGDEQVDRGERLTLRIIWTKGR